MSELKEDILKNFGNQLRIRVCGIYLEGNRLLLLKHHTIGANGVLWAPPGGGMHFAEHAEQTLVREFIEETGLTPTEYQLGFIHEYLNPPMHAVELFFIVTKVKGVAQLGKDPEMTRQQVLQELAFVDLETLKAIPDDQKHYILKNLQHWSQLLDRKGYSLDDQLNSL